SLSHVTKALQMAGDRDVVVMTVRVLGVDVEDDAVIDPKPTSAEKLLLSQVVGLAERHNGAFQLLIGPHATSSTPSRRRSIVCALRKSTSANRRLSRPTARHACWARPGNESRRMNR